MEHVYAPRPVAHVLPGEEVTDRGGGLTIQVPKQQPPITGSRKVGPVGEGGTGTGDREPRGLGWARLMDHGSWGQSREEQHFRRQSTSVIRVP